MNLTEAARLINESADTLKRSNDLAQAEEQRYITDALYRGDDWLQSATAEEKAKALSTIERICRNERDMESALLQIQLAMSSLIAQAAKNHVAICAENGRL